MEYFSILRLIPKCINTPAAAIPTKRKVGKRTTLNNVKFDADILRSNKIFCRVDFSGSRSLWSYLFFENEAGSVRFMPYAAHPT